MAGKFYDTKFQLAKINLKQFFLLQGETPTRKQYIAHMYNMDLTKPNVDMFNIMDCFQKEHQWVHGKLTLNGKDNHNPVFLDSVTSGLVNL